MAPETPQQKLSSDDLSDLDVQVEHQIAETARITDKDLRLMKAMVQLIKDNPPAMHQIFDLPWRTNDSAERILKSPSSTVPPNVSKLDFPPLPFPTARKRWEIELSFLLGIVRIYLLIGAGNPPSRMHASIDKYTSSL